MSPVSSTFTDRLPSHGLLLLRVIVAITLIARVVQFKSGMPPEAVALYVIAAGAGLLLLLGLWTSVAGIIVALSDLVIAFTYSHDPWLRVLLASLGLALALLGPGSWSVDTWRSGWKRIQIRRRDNCPDNCRDS